MSWLDLLIRSQGDHEDDGRAERFKTELHKYRELDDFRSILGVPLLVSFLVGGLAITWGVLEGSTIVGKCALAVGVACLVLCAGIWRAKEWARRVLPVVFSIVAVHQVITVVRSLPEVSAFNVAFATLSGIVVWYALGPHSKKHFAQARSILAGKRPLRPAELAALRRAQECSTDASAPRSTTKR